MDFMIFGNSGICIGVVGCREGQLAKPLLWAVWSNITKNLEQLTRGIITCVVPVLSDELVMTVDTDGLQDSVERDQRV